MREYLASFGVGRLLLAPLSIYLTYQARRLPRAAPARRLSTCAALFLLASVFFTSRAGPELALVASAAAVLVVLVLGYYLPIPTPPRATTRRIRRHVASVALFLGTAYGALSLAAADDTFRTGGTIGLTTGFLLALAARRAPIGGENEITYPEVHRLLVGAGLAFLLVAAAPLYLATARFAPGACLAAAVLLVFAAGAGLYFASASGVREIRVFLSLLLPGLALGAGAYFGLRDLMPRVALLLASRILLALAALFILRQYTRWGFIAAKTPVILLVLVSAAAFVSFFSYLTAPVRFAVLPSEVHLPLAASGALEIVLLLALPAVVAHYERGTMRVTWTLLTLGLYWEATLPSALLRSPTGPPDREATAAVLFAYALVALALSVSMRYIHLLHRALAAAIDAARRDGRPEPVA